MNKNIFRNPAARSWRDEPLDGEPTVFHASLPGYVPTPLIELPELAAELGAGRVFVKDESSRLGLPAFKILGASYAIDRVLQNATAERLIAATDGNHGRAVAHVARQRGIPATVYVPVNITDAAKDGIRSEGAELVELDMPYDDVVKHAAAQAGPGVLHIQDTAWDGYDEIPAMIVGGYDTMFKEIDDELARLGTAATIVAVPTGVGSLTQAVVSHYRRGDHTASVVSVEPESAAAILEALKAGEPVTVETGDTVMNGLNCGTVSALAWPVLRNGLDTAVAVSDAAALDAVKTLHELGVDSGPCGASTLAGMRALDGITQEDVIVLLSTEGRAANPAS